MDEDTLKNLSLDAFINERGGDITGHILLEFNGSTVGYYEDDLNLDMFEELLVCWFDLLNETADFLVKHDNVGLKLIENSTDWVLFEKRDDDKLIVSYVAKSTSSRLEKYVITGKLIDIDNYYWKEEEILMKHFQSEVVEVTEEFIGSIRKCNPSLLSSPTFASLLEFLSINKKSLEKK
jgi:hypothetical protein